MLTEKENKEIKKAMNTLDFISADPKERDRKNNKNYKINKRRSRELTEKIK